jgi:hypothetical protein
MSAFQIIYQITIPKQHDVEAFVTFMRDEYFPAVHKGPTRVGQVTNLVLLRGVTARHERTSRFLLQVGFNGLATGGVRVDDEEVQRKFESFGASIEKRRAYDEVAVWADAAEA